MAKWEIIDDIPKFPNGGATRELQSRSTSSNNTYGNLITPLKKETIQQSIEKNKPVIGTGSKNNPIILPEINVSSNSTTTQTTNLIPHYFPSQDATKVNQSITDKLNFQGIKLNTKPKVDIANVQKKLNDLKQEQASMSSLNGGLGPTNFFDMLKQRDRAQETGNLESKYQNQLPYKPLLNKADAVGTTMLTVGKYFAPPQVRQGLDYVLNAQDVVELYHNPIDTLNQASVASDALSFIKSKRTGLAPFNYLGDLITLKQKYDLFNEASNQTYQNGGKVKKSNWQIIEY